MTNNPYTYLRTLLDDGKHEELNHAFAAVLNSHLPRGKTYVVENYTTSLDALLPLWPKGWKWEVVMLASGQYVADAYGKHNLSVTTRPTPALAMLDCLLQVKEYEWKEKPNDQ